ncbi:MAG: DUF3987 domain-containing protein [Pseudomonadales bacterium]
MPARRLSPGETRVRNAQYWWARGVYTVRCLELAKKPDGKSWQNLRNKPDTFSRLYGSPGNIGALWGEPSNWIVDLDLDLDECCEVAPYIINHYVSQDTLAWGRSSRPHSHYALRVVGAATKKLQLPEIPNRGEQIGTVVELRSTGTQSLVPGSVHPDREQYRFSTRDADIAELPADAALSLVYEVAIAGVVLRYYPSRKGFRHDFVHSATGLLCHAGVSPDQTRRIMSAVLLVVKQRRRDDEPKDRESSVENTIELAAKGGRAHGGPRLIELGVPRPHVESLKLWARELSTTLDAAEATWSTPEPLDYILPPVEAFRHELLPPSIRAWVIDASYRANVAIEYVAVSLMVLIGSLIGRQMAFCPKMNDIWRVFANIWGLGIGTPGSKKSRAQSDARQFLERLIQQARQIYASELRDWESLELEDRKCTPSPILRRYMTNDPTHEKVGELISQGQHALAIVVDEIGGFIASLEKIGREGARAFYNEAWNGDSSQEIDRIGRGSIAIDGLCVSLLGNITVGAMNDLVTSVSAGGGADDGFLQRFQAAVYPDPPTYDFVDKAPDLVAQKRVQEVFDKLSSVEERVLSKEFHCTKSTRGPYVRSSKKAYELFKAKVVDVETRARSPEESPIMQAVLAKQPKLIAGIALIYHLVESPNGGPVSEQAMLAAVGWAELLESHARRIFYSAANFHHYAANQLLQKIQEGVLGTVFTVRDVYRKGWSGLSTKDTAVAAVEYLEDKGYLRPAPVENRIGRRAEKYEVNPAAYPREWGLNS